jgi:hypothetical protein
MSDLDPETQRRFRIAVGKLDASIGQAPTRLRDDNTDVELRKWLNDPGPPLARTNPSGAVTPDEWFFITTLYGEMTLDGQRTHIRAFYPALFVAAARRDVRNFVADLPEYAGLRSNWMKRRLATMGQLLRERGITMSEYVERLRAVEARATAADPMPALDAIIHDHHATGWKTLSVFVRDCVGANAFPIDTRVAKELQVAGLPADERLLVSHSLALGRNPRQIARMFYESGGEAE